MKNKIALIILMTASLFAACGTEKAEEEVRILGDQLHTVDTGFIQTNFAWPGGLWKAVTLSYDDGNIQDRQFVELLNRYGVKASFHLNSGKLGTEETWDITYSYINSNEVTTLYEGHEVSSHSVSHPNLKNTSSTFIRSQVGDDMNALSNLVGYPIRGMSYPFGGYDNTVFDTISELGIQYARTTARTHKYNLPSQFLRWKMTSHHTTATNDMPGFLEAEPGQMILFAIWGHSWEFDKDEENNNWEYIEGFLSEIGNRDDIWYATMIEITDYVTACEMAVFNEDGTVSNGSAVSLWINKDGATVELLPGQTL